MTPSHRDQSSARLGRVWSRASALGLDALLITHLPNVFYLTGLRSTAGAAVLSADGIELITDFRYLVAATRLASQQTDLPLEVTKVEGSYDETIRDSLVGRDLARVGVEADHLTLRRWTWLTESLGDLITLVATEGLVEAVRMVKDAAEIDTLRTAGRLLGRLTTPVLEFVCAGRTEREIAADIDRAVVATGFEDRAFETIVASGPNSAHPHARPEHRRLREGDLVVLDFGGVYNGYCVDLSRTVCVGQRRPDAVRLHQAVLDAQQAAIGVVRPGIPASDVDAAARGVLGRQGLAEAFGHSTGHGLGVELHEGPLIARARPEDALGSAVLLEAGMVFTVEPGVYLPEVGGVRIEDDVLVTSEGHDLLTDAPRALVVR